MNIKKKLISLPYYRNIYLSFLAIGSLLFSLSSKTLNAQVVPDQTLGNEGSVVTPDVDIKGILSEQINGGAIRNTNLFHSFQEFNINQGKGVYFTNPNGIRNIFTRVTGSNVSNLFGTLGVLGNANLFLINPNGMIFGENASLDLRGSFFGSTANSIRFNDGAQFSATNPQNNSLLTVSIPIGLEFRSNSGTIRVQGQGHNLEFNSRNGAVIAENRNEGIKVENRTLALSGSEIVIEGGNLTADSGLINLVAIIDGDLNLINDNQGLRIRRPRPNFDYGDIKLLDQASVSVSGESIGGINIFSKNLTLTNGSAILALIEENGIGSNLNIDVLESLELLGISSGGFPSGLFAQTFALGDAGNLRVRTKNLLLEGAQISATTFGEGKAGELNIIASDSIELIGDGVVFPTGLFAQTHDTGDGGNLIVDTANLILRDGAQISTSTFSFGDGGTLNVRASESVQFMGEGIRFRTGIFAQANRNSSGIGGNLTVDTGRLSVNDGGLISVGTQGSGKGGELNIRASDSVEIVGQRSDGRASSLISGTVGTGDGGDLIVETNNLTIRDGGVASVSSVFGTTIGEGNPGNLEIRANNVFLNNQGQITAESGSGEGGNINLQARNILELTSNSQISATAGTEGGGGNGGNINIDTSFFIALPSGDSDTTANAFEGQGGNININAKAILGTEFRDVQTIESDITASSEFGQSGNVDITTPNLNASQGLVELVTNPVNPSDLVRLNACSEGEQSELTIAGRGGLPPNPIGILNNDLLLVDFGYDDLTSSNDNRLNHAVSSKNLIPAQGWKKLDNGQMVLMANNSTDDLVKTGINNYQEGNLAEAIEVWEKAVLEFSRQGDKLNQALVLNNLAIALKEQGEWQKAIDTINSSKEIIPSEANELNMSVMAQTFNNEGIIKFELGDTQQALTSWQEAGKVYAQIGDEQKVISSLINQAKALQNLGLTLQAENLLEEIYTTLQNKPDSILKANGIYSYGDILRSTGKFSKSEEILQESLSIAQNLNAVQQIEAIELSLANTARFQQDRRKALQYYQDATSSTSNLPETLKIKGQLNKLSLLIQQKRLFSLKTLLPEIESQLKNLPPSRTSIYAHINFAHNLSDLQKINSNYQSFSVLEVLETALQQAREIGDKRGEIYANGHLGEYYEQKKEYSKAQQFTEQALIIIESIKADDISYLWQWQLARILRITGNKKDAIAAYNLAFDTLQKIRSDLAAVNQEVQFSFRESVEPTYRELVALLLEDNPSQADIIQAREIMESLQLAELDNFFQDACSTVEQVQIDDIDSSTAIIYPIILRNRLDVIISLPGQPLVHYSTSITQNEVENAVERLQRSLFQNPIQSNRFDTKYLKDAQVLYQVLIQPAEEYLSSSNIKNLTFVLDGAIRNIPMAILHDGQQYLLEKYAIALTPGLQLLNPQPLERGNLTALTAGLTEARQDFGALPNIAIELKQIETELNTKILLNKEFTKDNLQTAIENKYFPVLHLATHGQFSSKIEDTFLLTWDGYINAKDLDNLLRRDNAVDSQPLELLVLSACQTAAGDSRAALGLAGIAVKAGARSTLATLWLVDDRGTTELMGKFYEELAQTDGTKAEALRQAQLFLLNDGEHEHPFYWAPFVLVGNWL